MLADMVRRLTWRQPAVTPAPLIVELDARLRAFSCPTGLHDFCSSSARHDLPVDTGLTG